ncbi:MAG: hypothetical protein M1816_005408 [Peltula sp. TS41687]|nr:MAG: hypothetical protein M1816_005408 [Peltula sp. TS41687]
MSANTHWTRSRSVAAEKGCAEDPSQEQGSMADPPVRPEHDRGRSPTPSSDDYDEMEERGDDERALQRALKAIQKKRRVAALHRQIEAERKALEEGAPLPTLTGAIRPRSDTSATMAPAPKRSRRNGSDSEDDSRLRVKDPKTYEGKNQGELTPSPWTASVFLGPSWNLKVERLGDDYRTWSNLKDCLQNDLRPKALRAKDACSKWLQASQHQNQTVSSFVNYIDQLEKDLPPISEDMKGLRLMCAFRPEIELAIEQQADIPETREGLITLAINIDGAHTGQRTANASYAQAASGMRSGGSSKDKGKAKADHKGKEEAKPKERQGGYKATPRVEKQTTTADGRPICFNCTEPGHISKSCLKPKKERGEGKKVAQLKAAPSQKEDKKSVSINAVLHQQREKQEGKPYLFTAVQNFISHLRAVELGIKPRLDEATPKVTTIDETQLQVYGVYRPRIRATDNSGTTGELHSRLLAVSFTGWDIVLGWPWLKELNPDIKLERRALEL